MPNIFKKLNSFTAMRVKYGSYAVIASSGAPTTITFIIVAGGGGGGAWDGGSGGGAGGFRSFVSQPLSSGMTITVGAGGTGGRGTAYGTTSAGYGYNSVGFGQTTTRGGAGQQGANSVGVGTGGSSSGAWNNGAVEPANQGGYSPVEGYSGGDGQNIYG